jgi:hypothetical protein
MIVLAARTPWTTAMKMSWLGSWWGPNDRVDVAAPIIDCCWNPPKRVHTKCTLTKSGSTGTERKSRDESRRGTLYLLLTGPTGSYV